MTTPMGDDRSDAELLEAWRRGDAAAGRLLFGKYFDTLHGFFRRRALGSEQDLTQRTLLACVEGKLRFRGDASFRTYLYSVARFQLLAHYREQRRQGHSVPVGDEAGQLTSPSAAVARKQTHRLLLEALRRLPRKHQEMLALSYWDSLSGVQIASRLGIPETTVRNRIRAANQRLRELIRELAAADTTLGETRDDLLRWAQRSRTDLRLSSGAG